MGRKNICVFRTIMARLTKQVKLGVLPERAHYVVHSKNESNEDELMERFDLGFGIWDGDADADGECGLWKREDWMNNCYCCFPSTVFRLSTKCQKL
jgi:hypothetical protein